MEGNPTSLDSGLTYVGYGYKQVGSVGSKIMVPQGCADNGTLSMPPEL